MSVHSPKFDRPSQVPVGTACIGQRGKSLTRMIAVSAMVFTLQLSQAIAEPGVGQALSAWQQGDLGAASAEIALAIEDGSADPRLWYLRGVITEQTGGDGMDDFHKAAQLEIATSSTRIVNQALEKMQGPVRGKIEAARAAARAAVSPDPLAAHTSILYRNAVTLLNLGHTDQALVLFDNAIAEGTRDARVHYLRGVVLARQGLLDEARAAFRTGLAMETTYEQVVAVNIALHNVQGDVRQIIEEQIHLGSGDAVVTRQSNQRAIIAEHRQLQRDLLAGDGEKLQQLMAEAEASRRAKEEEAARRILEEERQRAETAALIKQAESNLNAPEPTVTGPVSPVPQAPVPVTPGAAVTTPPAATSPPANPFLAGAGSTADSSGAELDTSWLAPNTELVFYARPADILNSPFMAPVLNLPDVQQKVDEITELQGLPLAQIESVTGGMGDLMAKIMGLAMGGAGDPAAAMSQFMNNPSAISVIRLSTDFDFAAVAADRNFAAVSHGDQTYFILPTPDVPANVNLEIPSSAICQINSNTLLSGTEVALKAALDRGPGQPNMPQFGFLTTASHLTFGFSNPALAAMSGSIPTPQQAPPMVQEFVEAIKGRVNGIALAFTMSADLKLDVKLSLNDASAATTALTPLQSTLQIAQQMYPMAKQGGIPPELHPVLDQTVASLKASRARNLLNISITIPGQLVTVLMSNPQLMQPQFTPGGPGLPAEDPSEGFRPALPGTPPGTPAAPGNNPSQGFGFPPGQSSPPAQN